MIRRENVLKKFIIGMSVLEAYIKYTGKLNMNDINVSAESFTRDLLNILYLVENYFLKLKAFCRIATR